MQLQEEVICHIRWKQGAAVNFWHLAPVNVFYKSACTDIPACRFCAKTQKSLNKHVVHLAALCIACS